MYNIWKIFTTDIRRISNNVVAVVIIMGLSILPALYAWFNIFSNWDPYEPAATSQLKVAVASDDAGAEIMGLSLNVGDSVLEALGANTTIGWVFPETTEEALEGVKNSDYYAALIIPETFTQEMLGFIDGEVDHPTIYYYENEKKNGIAPKITGKAKNAVQEQSSPNSLLRSSSVITVSSTTSCRIPATMVSLSSFRSARMIATFKGWMI